MKSGYFIYMTINKSGSLFISSGLYKKNGKPFKDSSSDRWFVYIGEL